MAFYLMIGSRGSVVSPKDAQYFQSLEAAKANVGIAECALIVESDKGYDLLKDAYLGAKELLYYTRECGWFKSDRVLPDDNPFYCSQEWILED